MLLRIYDLSARIYCIIMRGFILIWMQLYVDIRRLGCKLDILTLSMFFYELYKTLFLIFEELKSSYQKHEETTKLTECLPTYFEQTKL